MPASDWSRATVSDEVVSLILMLVIEHYEATGNWPTLAELTVLLRHPGS